MSKSDTEHLLELAHRRGIITEWAPQLTREAINRACLSYGPEGVVEYLRHEWTPKRPTTNYCWVVSEVALRLIMPKGTTCWQIDVDGNGRYHWFLKDASGTIVDLTLDQAEGWWEMPEYDKAKRYNFRPAMSRRGKKQRSCLGLPRESTKGRKHILPIAIATPPYVKKCAQLHI